MPQRILSIIGAHPSKFLWLYLANEIIKAQQREIKEMNWLLEDISQNGIVETQAEAKERPIPEFEAES